MKKEELYKVFKLCDYLAEEYEMPQILEDLTERERFEFEFTYYYGGVGSGRGEEILIEFFKAMLKQIKNSGLYEEFIRLGMLGENIATFIRIIDAETEFPSGSVEEYVLKYGINDNSVRMIIATGDIDFIKKFIENQKSKSNWHLIANLVAATKESTYIQSFIENDISKYFPEFSKRVLNDENKLTTLIVATGDDEYILKCLEHPPFNINMHHENRLKLILAMKDIDLVYSSLNKYLRRIRH